MLNLKKTMQGKDFLKLLDVTPEEIGELVDILSQGLCCERAEAERVFLAFFAVVHGLGSLLCNNAMAYDETRCTEMLETVFYGALASLKGDNHA